MAMATNIATVRMENTATMGSRIGLVGLYLRNILLPLLDLNADCYLRLVENIIEPLVLAYKIYLYSYSVNRCYMM